MMERLVFLDIDGVLNTAAFLEQETEGNGVRIVDGELDATEHIDPSRIAHLNRLVELSGAKVVLSSSWRVLFGVDKTQRSLASRGFAHTLQGATLRLPGQPRHEEIRAYLSGFPSPPSFVVLDDELNAGTGFGDHFVHVSDGLTADHVEVALAVLARPALGPST